MNELQTAINVLRSLKNMYIDYANQTPYPQRLVYLNLIEVFDKAIASMKREMNSVYGFKEE